MYKGLIFSPYFIVPPTPPPSGASATGCGVQAKAMAMSTEPSKSFGRHLQLLLRGAGARMSEGLSTVERPEFSCPSKACEARFDSGSLRERPRRRCAVTSRHQGDTNFLKNSNKGASFVPIVI